jgi:hypothetical protein
MAHFLFASAPERPSRYLETIHVPETFLESQICRGSPRWAIAEADATDCPRATAALSVCMTSSMGVKVSQEWTQ